MGVPQEKQNIRIYACKLRSLTDIKKGEPRRLLVFKNLKNDKCLGGLVNILAFGYKIYDNYICLNGLNVPIYILSSSSFALEAYLREITITVNANEKVRNLFVEQTVLVRKQHEANVNYKVGDTCKSYEGLAWFDLTKGAFFSFSRDGIYIVAQYLLELSKQKLITKRR